MVVIGFKICSCASDIMIWLSRFIYFCDVKSWWEPDFIISFWGWSLFYCTFVCFIIWCNLLHFCNELVSFENINLDMSWRAVVASCLILIWGIFIFLNSRYASFSPVICIHASLMKLWHSSSREDLIWKNGNIIF